MWRLSIPIMLYRNAVIGWAGVSSTDEKGSDCKYAPPTPKGKAGLSGDNKPNCKEGKRMRGLTQSLGIQATLQGRTD
jgi:hypothetical protein